VPVLRLDPKDQNERVPSPTLSIHPGPLILCTGDEPLDLRGERPVLAVGAEALKHSERSFAWRELFPDAAECAALLAARYTLEPARVAEVVADVSVEPDRRSDTLLSRVAESVRVRSTRTLSAGVELLRARAGWNDLVLTPEQHTQLREAVDRLLYQSKVLDDWGLLARKRGARGVRMLFAGPPGTGKTLSAEVLAHELGVDLLLVDLSRVVSKWIGETEKNLAQVFEAAEESQTVLLFDEADALFGKRTEVSDARDRYANLETAYLLTRLETFEGLAVLSTNLRNNIDAAFTRRLEFIIDFPEPGVAQREALWRAHLPPAVPLASDVDFAEVAALYPLVGGSIRNAAVASAFMAASQRTAVTRDLVVRAIRREYHKSGKAFPGAPVGMMNEATARTACPH
jgi:SpoVK/Ycf46/Vps4 family AAA+-type ATPase